MKSLMRKFIPAIILTAAVLLGMALYAEAGPLFAALASFDLRVLPLVLGLVTLGYGIRYLRWQYYLRLLGIDVPPSASRRIFFSGLSMAITPGKLGEVLKCFMLRSNFDVRLALSVPVVVAERFTDLAGVFVLAALTVVGFSGGGPVLLAAGVLIGAMVVAALASGKLVDWAGALLSRTLFARQEVRIDWARESAALFRRLLRGKPLATGGALAVTAWFLECLAFLLVIQGFGQDGITLYSATFTYASATLAGAFSMLPGGLGATEGSMTVLLAGIGLSREAATGATLLIRACTLWWGVLLGLAAYATFGGGRMPGDIDWSSANRHSDE